MTRNRTKNRALSPFALILTGCLSPVFAADAPLVLDNGIPAHSNYTAIDSGAVNRGAVSAAENVWVNFTGEGEISGAITAADAETRYHVKLTAGTMTGNDGATFAVNNAWQAQIRQPVTAASLWIHNGRVPLKSKTALDTVGTVYVAGGQLWFDGDGADAAINAIVVGTSNYSGDSANNYNKAAIRMDANASVTGLTSVISPARFTFSNGKTLTLASLGGSGDLELKNYTQSKTGGFLKINASSEYTGTITIQNNGLEFGGAVTGLPRLIMAQDPAMPEKTVTLKLNAPATLAPGTAFNSGIIDLSAAPLSDTAAAITIPDATVTFAHGLTINLGTGRPANATFRVFGVADGADYAAAFEKINVTLNGRSAFINPAGYVTGYPDIRSANSFETQVVHTGQDLWVNVSVNGGAIKAGIDAAGHNLKITSGTLTGTPPDPSTYSPQNGSTKLLNGPISAASLSIESGRLSPNATGLLANAGTVYLNGGHIYPAGGETFANDFVFNTASYTEGNSYGGSVYRVDSATAFNGSATIRTGSEFCFGGSGMLSFANLRGAGNVILDLYGGTGHILTVDNTDDYTGTILMNNAQISLKLAAGRAAAPRFTLTAGSFIPQMPVTLRAGTALTSGTVDFSGVTLNAATPAMTIPAGAAVSVGAGVAFQMGANYSFPVTLKLFEGPAPAGWNPQTATVLMGAVAPTARTVNADGSITFDIELQPIAFTTPSADWEAKTFPAGTLESIVPAGASVGFGTQPAFVQTLGGKASTVVNVTGGGDSAANIYGMYGRATPPAAFERDVWLAVTGGTFLRVVGGAESEWTSNASGSITGDILVEMRGTSKAGALIGGFQESAFATRFITGNIGVVLGEEALVSGSVIGFANSAHSQTSTLNGNTAVLVKNVQSDTNYASATAPANTAAGWIVGGGMWSTANAGSGAVVNGNTAVAVDIPEGKTGIFRKALVGGSHSVNLGAAPFTVSGSTGVSITAPETVRFLDPVVGGGYTTGNAPATAGSSSVTLNGGTFLAEVVAGGSGAQASVAGDAVLNVNGGVLANTVLRGSSAASTVGGLKRLRVSGERAIDLTGTTVIDFNAVEATGGATLTLGQATQVDAATAANGGKLVIAGKTSAQALDSAAFRHIRLTVADWPRSNPNGNLGNHSNTGVAIGEFRLTSGGEPVSWGTGASIAGIPAGSGNEGVASMIDGNPNTKFFTAPGTEPAYQFTVTRGADAPAFDGYQILGSDQAGRSPRVWTLSASVDGASWVVLDQQALTYASLAGWNYGVVKSFTCARTGVASAIGAVTVAEGGTLTGSGRLIGNLAFEAGSTLLKTSTDPAEAPWVEGTVSGGATVVGPDLEFTSATRQYLLTGPGAVAADASAFQAAEGLVVRNDDTGLYLTRQSGIMIMLF